MQKSLAKTKTIQEAALAYKNNNSLSDRKAAKLMESPIKPWLITILVKQYLHQMFL